MSTSHWTNNRPSLMRGVGGYGRAGSAGRLSSYSSAFS
ncbi:hypothetical protein AMC99_01435 [Altererythrobacter epoxidivorans]|uniref:Uncharacterized protein n=1 Tax=Altererythrobacter epoxidivorans TaxID=361183 RepID=A0A0M4M4K0_9SPHN|nr:hypothetical protein AMC99_01435 [Altererythrobacter epoxidivorans]